MGCVERDVRVDCPSIDSGLGRSPEEEESPSAKPIALDPKKAGCARQPKKG
jgi:hypothetical protein